MFRTLFVLIMFIGSLFIAAGTVSAEGGLTCYNGGLIKVASNSVTNDTVDGSCLYQNVRNADYTFSLPDPPFDYSASPPDNDSITGMTLIAYPSRDAFTIEGTTWFEITTGWNNGESIAVNFLYEKHGWGIFGYWKSFYTVKINGEEVCRAEADNYYNGKNSIIVKPHLDVRSGGIVADLDGDGYRSNYTDPSYLYYSFRDSFTKGDTDRSTGIAYYFDSKRPEECDVVTDDTSSDRYIAFTHLTSPPTITITTSEIEQYRSHFIGASFGNRTMTSALIEHADQGFKAFGEGLERSNPFCAGGFFAFSFCFLTRSIVGVVEWFIGLVVEMVKLLFSIFPGGEMLSTILVYPIDLSLDIVKTLLTIYFMPGSGYGPGGIYLSLVVWSACFGAGLAAITGNLRYMWSVPTGFLKWSTIGVALGFYYVYYKIPKEGLSLIIDGLKIARG